jgi:hypothetical protein
LQQDVSREDTMKDRLLAAVTDDWHRSMIGFVQQDHSWSFSLSSHKPFLAAAKGFAGFVPSANVRFVTRPGWMSTRIDHRLAM